MSISHSLNRDDVEADKESKRTNSGDLLSEVMYLNVLPENSIEGEYVELESSILTPDCLVLGERTPATDLKLGEMKLPIELRIAHVFLPLLLLILLTMLSQNGANERGPELSTKPTPVRVEGDSFQEGAYPPLFRTGPVLSPRELGMREA